MSPDDDWRFPNRATPLGSAAYYAVRFAPEAQRNGSAALLAWHDQVTSLAGHGRDPGVARLKLDWWRDECHQLDHGQPRHPLTLALATCGIGAAAVAPMQAIVDAAERAILAPPRDDDGFAAMCGGLYGELFVLLTAAAPGQVHDAAGCRATGAYVGMVERIRRLAVLPHGMPPDLTAEALRTMDRQQRSERLDHLLTQAQPAQVPATLAIPDVARRLGCLAAAMHKKMRRSGYPVADNLIDRPPVAHLWTAWRCR